VESGYNKKKSEKSLHRFENKREMEIWKEVKSAFKNDDFSLRYL